ncbi:saccharopine dehydrogenase family protein [Komagataeibacter sp. FNDCF1]|uniref:saccharopine dehydrogenase family protein n=1 Tax=Komagataeibacter sp. FNDCF1 TaxID=2878681 RepID=UPI001E2A1BA8|nr:saccharopine dehydrogenase C-terminal domain-containing protein [Komagataeibacter sp. FNDCF1]MCE2565262.1 saccharopine dehydrogenase NADP-binding domain-containing protein [Komagataeibacter sp. FNDCF1]
MKIAILGGAGIQALGIVADLLRYEAACDILLIDIAARALERRMAHFGHDPRLFSATCDLTDEARIAALAKDCDTVVMSGPPGLCLPAMRAVLQCGRNYVDLGTFPEETQAQQALHDDFVAAGRTAVLGMGSAPGITSVMARACADRLDRVLDVDITIAMRDLTDRNGRIRWPFSADAILDEHTEPARAFIDGQLVDLPPRTGRRETFPAPIGTVTAYCTNHPEPTTISASLAHKGVRNVVFRIALPDDVDHAVSMMNTLGLARRRTLSMHDGTRVDLRAVVLAALMETPQDVADREEQWSATRVTVRGMAGAESMEYRADMIVAPQPHWNLPAGLIKTAVPPAILAAQMARGVPMPYGVHVPETCIEPEPFFAALSLRGMDVHLGVVEMAGADR